MLRRGGVRLWLAWACAATVGLWQGSVCAEMARYDVDLDHSTVEFRVAHMVVSKTSGRFMDY